MVRLLCFIIFYLTINFVNSQINNEAYNSNSQLISSNNWVIDYPDNTKLPFTISEIKKLEYVYLENLKMQILNKPSRVLDFKHIFRNRIFIQKEEIKDISNYPLLSTVPVFNIFNETMQIPSFIAEDFNPFVYNFNFNSKSRLIYRVDNTQYLVIIKSKFN